MTTCHVIRKDTWHYRIWKFTNYFRSDKNILTHTNLCRYVSRTIFYPIPIAFGLVWLICLVILILVIGNALTILSGTGVFGIFEGEKNAKSQTEFMWYFPHISVGTRQLPISTFVLPLYVLLFAAAVYMYPSTAMTYAGYGAGGLGVLALLYVIGAIILDGRRRVRRWEGWMLSRAYLKAKKDGVCPLITFEEPDHPPPAEVGGLKTA